MTAGWRFPFAAVTPNARDSSGLGQTAQHSLLVPGSMPAPVAVRGFCVTLAGGDRGTDLAHNLFLKKTVDSRPPLACCLSQLLASDASAGAPDNSNNK